MAKDLIDGLIRKQRGIGVHATGGKGCVAADEQPQVAVADHGHQKRREPVDVANAVVRLAVDLRKFTTDRLLGLMKRSFPQLDAVCLHSSSQRSLAALP